MSKRNPSPVRHVDYGIDPKHALAVFGINLFGNPTLFVRELIANAIDATLDVPEPTGPIHVRVEENNLLTVRDHGTGMSEKTMEQVLPVFFKTTRDKENPRHIGVFGIGLYASLGYAHQVLIRSRTRDADFATMGIFGETGITLQPINWDGPGTEVSVYLSREAPRSVTDKDALHKFLEAVFTFSPVDIYLNSTLVAGPSCFDPPWQEAASLEGWSPFPATDDTDPTTPPTLHVIRREHEIAQFALFLTRERIPRNQRNLRLLAKRVRVGDSYWPMGYASLGTFVAGVINANEVELTVVRDSMVEEAASVRALDTLFFQVLGDGLREFAEERPSAFQRFANEHRNDLLDACSKFDDLRQPIQTHIPFRTGNGDWQSLSVAAEHGHAYYAAHSEQLAVLSAVSDLDQPVFLFESAAEQAFLTRLREGSLPGVKWEPVDKLAVAAPGDRLYFRSQQVKSALQHLERTTRSPSAIKHLPKRTVSVVRSGVTEVEVVNAPKDRRAAWLVPRLKSGRREEGVFRESRKTVIQEGDLPESSSYFETQVRRHAHESGFDRVLFLNYAHPLVPMFFDVLGSVRNRDQELAGFLLGGLLAIARNESFKDWPLWNADFGDNAVQLMNLVTLLLTIYREQQENERSLDNESH